jgi:hypothetical protein
MADFWGSPRLHFLHGVLVADNPPHPQYLEAAFCYLGGDPRFGK